MEKGVHIQRLESSEAHIIIPFTETFVYRALIKTGLKCKNCLITNLSSQLLIWPILKIRLSSMSFWQWLTHQQIFKNWLLSKQNSNFLLHPILRLIDQFFWIQKQELWWLKGIWLAWLNTSKQQKIWMFLIKLNSSQLKTIPIWSLYQLNTKIKSEK